MKKDHRSTQKIFIITHGPVYEEFYKCDSSFDPRLFTIVMVGKGPCQKCSIPLDSIRISSLQGFRPLGKRWAETEAIYGVFCSGIYLAYSYIGFIHYDYKLYDGFCDQLRSILAISGPNFISFSTFNFLDDYRQRIILDRARPNVLQAKGGPSCYKSLIKHYNLVYGTNLSVWNLAEKRICLCSAYFCTTTIFTDLMKLIDFSIASKALDLYDVENNHRIQGGMAERYVAIYSSQINFLEMELCHEYKYYKKSLKMPAG